MQLEKLVLHGFKSFADKTTFDFTKPFTAIVGPNGSGKSNVADAIRWVLGEQSMKLLRGKASADLIFGGSEKLAKMGMAQVELHLDNSSGQFPVEFQEVVISRKLFRSGDSEYRLNGSKVRLSDIVMMLAQARFGQKSYAVIGQGMITEFLNATPQQRKEFFDEATGVKEFQIKRDKAINKLIRTEEHLVQSEALITEIEPHLNSLERQVKRLEKREKLEEELSDLFVDYYGSLWHGLQSDLLKLKQQIGTLDAEEEQLEKLLAEKQAASDAVAGEASRGERYEVLQQQFNSLLEQKSLVLKEQAVLKGKLEVEHERQGELSLVWLQRKEDEIAGDLQKHESDLQVLNEQVRREEAELARREKQLAGLDTDFREEEYTVLQLKERIEQEAHAMTMPEVQEELQVIFADHEEFLRSLLQTQSMDEFRAVQSEAKKVAKRFAVFMDKLTADKRSTVEALRVDMRQKEQVLERLVEQRNGEQRAVNELRVRIESAKAKVQLLQTQVTRLQEEIAEVRGEISDAEEAKSDDYQQKQSALYMQQLKELEKEITGFDTKIAAVRSEIDQFNTQEEEKKSRLVAVQTEMRSIQRKINGVQQQMNTVEVSMARIETRQEDVASEVRRDVPEELHNNIFGYDAEQNEHTISDNDRVALQKRMLSLQRQLAAIGEIDEATVNEYNETKERYDFLTEQTQDLDASIGDLEKIIDELDATIKRQFQKNFKIINDGFQEYFKVLFGGGKARLEMIMDEEVEEQKQAAQPQTEAEAAMQEAMGGSDDELVSEGEERARELIGKKKKRQKVVSGIDVMAHPPGKKITNITSLSGGEKSMVSIALICSIIAHNPSPFVFLDEVEAALDEENSEKLAAILRELAKKTQIIAITHNRVSMRAADMLYGVTIGTEGKSHILSVELDEAEGMVEVDAE